MSSIGRKEYLREVNVQYAKANRATKSQLLTAAESVTGLHRKSLVRLLGRRVGSRAQSFTKRGRTAHYDADFHDALLVCWHAANDICAERLQPFLPELVARLEACHELRVTNSTKDRLLTASISTVARHLRQAKRRSTISLGTTKPGSLLKSQIAVRHGRWDETSPGWLESDTVAHGGDSMAGQFIHTYNFVDICTGWTEAMAAMGLGERATVQGFSEIRSRLPFPVLGIDSDNGGEYVNYTLYRYCQREGITFTRSRSYQKNDNAHVEQKNWEAIRKMVGYDRLDTMEQLALLNELYFGPLRLFLNYFQPTRKRKVETIDTATGKATKRYFEAKTPYQRVVSHTSQEVHDLLTSEYTALNPVKLLAEIRNLLDRLSKTLR